MWEELNPISKAISQSSLPPEFDQLFGPIWDRSSFRFTTQENFILDFKETLPEKFSDDYGGGLIRLALAFYNSFGGLIVFGVKDRTLKPVGVQAQFDVEFFNRALSDFSGRQIECIAKTYAVPGSNGACIAVALVPRRSNERPAKLVQRLGKYPIGATWVRERHEVLEATSRHLGLLYSDRSHLPSEVPDAVSLAVHRSFPPSPSTVRDFVGRFDLLRSLWEWAVFGDQPRLYLDGPGGSGKTTLAFEFARMLVEAGPQIRFPDGEALDYVVFISAKEVEFNSHSAKQQPFSMRNFSTAYQQFTQILYHSGLLDQSEIETASEARIDELLSDLFNNFNGLLVIDDIDSLSRRKVDTGEETLMIKALTCTKRTRLLYTLRFPAAYALKSSLAVPGLDEQTELIPFIDTCCKQFSVVQPTGESIPSIAAATGRLPLILETVIGIRKYAGTYTAALREYKDKGGDEARRYLYQREYDSFEADGKTRYVLAGLMLVEAPMSFSVMCRLLNYSSEQIRDALTEAAGIFLSTIDVDDSGETLYQVTPPSVPFIKQVSSSLPYFSQLQRTVEHFNTQGSYSTPEERATIVEMERLIKQGRFSELVGLEDKFRAGDPVLVNPRIRALLGQAWSEIGANGREKARGYFRAAESVGFHDVFMMRRWYHMELRSGYGLSEAEHVCQLMISDSKISARYRSEFLSKLAYCQLLQAQSHAYTNREKCLSGLKASVLTYLEALWTGQHVNEIENSETLGWLEKPLIRLIDFSGQDAEEVLMLVERIADNEHDVQQDGAALIMHYLLRLPAPQTKEARAKIRSLCNRTVGKIRRNMRGKSFPGLQSIIEPLDALRVHFETIDLGEP